MKKPVGTTVKFTETVHPSALCEPGDILETSTGRRYEVIEVAGRSIKAIVLRPGATVAADARILRWTWHPRCKPEQGLPFTRGTAP